MVATKPVDFRKGHDGLAALVKNELHKDPGAGTVFVFLSRRADRLKLLYWDGTGLVMAYKRLEEHTFTWPAIKDGVMGLGHAQFEALFVVSKTRLRRVEDAPPACRRRASGTMASIGDASGLWKRGLRWRWNSCGKMPRWAVLAGDRGWILLWFGHVEPRQSPR